MLSYKNKKFVENFVRQFINVQLKLIVLHALLCRYKSVSVACLEMSSIDSMQATRQTDSILPVDLACFLG